jgi:hypothetical protein
MKSYKLTLTAETEGRKRVKKVKAETPEGAMEEAVPELRHEIVEVIEAGGATYYYFAGQGLEIEVMEAK